MHEAQPGEGAERRRQHARLEKGLEAGSDARGRSDELQPQQPQQVQVEPLSRKRGAPARGREHETLQQRGALCGQRLVRLGLGLGLG